MGTLSMVLVSILCVLLGVVGVLLLFAYARLQNFTKSGEQLPILSNKLAEHLVATRKAVEELARSARTHAPQLQAQVDVAKTTQQDLEFLVSRAEAVLLKLEHKIATAKGYTEEQELVNLATSGRPNFTLTSPEEPMPRPKPVLRAVENTPRPASKPTSQAERELRKALAERL